MEFTTGYLIFRSAAFVCAYDAGSSAVVRWQHGITHAVRADCRRGVYHDLEL